VRSWRATARRGRSPSGATGSSCPTCADPRAIGYLLDSSVATPREALAQVPAPTLVVAGEADSRGASAGELAALLPNGRLALVPGDHVTAPSAPEFTDAIANFLG
jgi:pimeloyl-ACP methyl ester carboxylesterase